MIGVEPELAADAQASFRAGEIVKFPAEQVLSTSADGLRSQYVGTLTFEHIRRYVDDVVTVSEEDIFNAVRILAENPKTIAEPSGAVAPAAWLFHRGLAARIQPSQSRSSVEEMSIRNYSKKRILSEKGRDFGFRL